MSVTLAKVTIQSAVTFTETALGLMPTITFTNGAVAGSEVVTVTGGTSPNITVQIASGTSTALQIKTAVLASPDALYWVTPSVESGQNSTAIKTCVLASLSGGTAAAKASLTVAPLKFIAKSAGAAGSSVRIKFTSGATAGSEAITVSTNDVTIQIANGVSTAAQIKAAVEASASSGNDADALMNVLSSGPALSIKMNVGMLAAFTALSGGTDAVSPSTTVQNLVFTAVATGTSKNGKKISYTHGATAGAEVVTVDASGNVTVQIENEVSTATQIKAALDAAATFTTPYSVATTGTASTAQKTVNAEVMTGAVALGPDYFSNNATGTALTASFARQSFGFAATDILIINDETSGAKGVVYSFDGVNTHGTLLFGQVLNLSNVDSPTGIWFKYVSAAPAYRISAWRRV